MALLERSLEASNKKRHLIITIGALVLIAAVVLYFTFRFYPEQRAAQRFFDALVPGDTMPPPAFRNGGPRHAPQACRGTGARPPAVLPQALRQWERLVRTGSAYGA